MKNIIKNILKEEHDQKLKGFVYNYFDKKIKSGEWRWVEKTHNDVLMPFTEIFLISSRDNFILLEYDKYGYLHVYSTVNNKFSDILSINSNQFKSIITRYIEDRLNIEVNHTLIWSNKSGYLDESNNYLIRENNNKKIEQYILKYLKNKLKSRKWFWIERLFPHKQLELLDNGKILISIIDGYDLILDKFHTRVQIYEDFYFNLINTFGVHEDIINKVLEKFLKEHIKHKDVKYKIV